MERDSKNYNRISTAGNNVYNQLLDYRLLGNSFGISSGSFLFTNLVLANATEPYTNTLPTIMTNTIFHSPNFEFKGIPIPEFDIESGKLTRLCVPNFDSNGNDLVRDFRYELLNHFEKIIPKSKWSKEYSKSGILKLWKSVTVEKYIIDKLNADKTQAKKIAEYLKLDFKQKVDKLTLGNQKALSIKCDFEKHEILIFDYYGVGANEFEYLENIVDAEIKKGKCGIAIDRLEFNQKSETNKNINLAEITVGNNVYSS